MQLQNDLVQLFLRLDLAVLDQLRDLINENVSSLRQASGEGQGSSGEQGSQSLHEVLSLGEPFK